MRGPEHAQVKGSPETDSSGLRSLEGSPLTVAENLGGEEWDEFLQATPGGYHGQSSMWARVKERAGWRNQKLVLLDRDLIIAGVQILFKKVGIWTLASIPGGPLIASEDVEVREIMLREILGFARRARFSYLLIHPLSEDQVLEDALARAGFQSSLQEPISRATILLDLSLTLDDLLVQMHSKHRQHIHRAEREGLVVRECSEEDLPTFHRLAVVRARRHRFTPEPFEALKAIWRNFGGRGLVRATIVYYGEEAVAASMAIAFGDTVFMKRGGWNGTHGALGPNEYLHWDAIRWAHARRYRWVDLEGIDLEAAQSVLYGNPLSYPLERSPNAFKLGFGGQVILRPAARECVFHPLLRWGYRSVYPAVRSFHSGRTLVRLIRRLR